MTTIVVKEQEDIITELKRLEKNWINTLDYRSEADIIIRHKLSSANELTRFCEKRFKMHDVQLNRDDLRLYNEARMFKLLYGEKYALY